MPFTPKSPIRGYPTRKMPSPFRTATEIPDTPITGSTLVATTSDASQVTRPSNYTSKTIGRARQNWRGSISSAVGSFRRSNATATSNPARLGPISAPIRRVSVGTTDESPTDPALILSGSYELPVSPVRPITGPDELRSFLDLESDDSEDDRPYSQHIMSRANSGRVQRPKMVEHNSGDHSSQAASQMTIEVYNGVLLSPRSAPSVPSRMSIHEEESQVPKTPATEMTNESTRGMGPEHAYKKLTANAPSPQFISRFSVTTVNTPLATGVDTPLPMGVDTPLPTPMSNAETVDSTAGLGPEAALNALTCEDGASTTVLVPTPKSQTSTVSPTQESDRDSVCTRIKATVIEVPSTVTVQSTLPSPFGGFDSVDSNTAIRGKQNLFTDSAMRTPYQLSPLSMNPGEPCRHRAISVPPLPHQNPNRRVTIRPSDLVIADSSDHRLFRSQFVSTPYPTRNGNVANHGEPLAEKNGLTTVSEEKDRFPFPSRAEVLVLQLGTAHNPGLKETMVIEIADKVTFDDEQLFKNIQRAYSNDLLGQARRIFSARQLSHATFSNDTSFDAADFIKHLKDPKTGHKRKAWLLWLQQHQPIISDTLQDRSRDSYASYYSPSSIPLMPFQRSLPQPPKVVLQFEFSILAIAMAVLVCLSLSCLSTLLWVLVGVSDSASLSERNWRQGAEGRVLTGLVLGILVLSLSSLGSAMWIGGSYVLL